MYRDKPRERRTAGQDPTDGAQGDPQGPGRYAQRHKPMNRMIAGDGGGQHEHNRAITIRISGDGVTLKAHPPRR